MYEISNKQQRIFLDGICRINGRGSSDGGGFGLGKKEEEMRFWDTEKGGICRLAGYPPFKGWLSEFFLSLHYLIRQGINFITS